MRFGRLYGKVGSIRHVVLEAVLMIGIIVLTEIFQRFVKVNVNGKGTGGLGMCQGDCDRDSDWYSGLRCFQREDTRLFQVVSIWVKLGLLRGQKVFILAQRQR